MLDLRDFEPGPLSRVEGQQHRLLWSKHLFGQEQHKVWISWLKIGGALIAAAGTLSSLWTFVFHGAA